MSKKETGSASYGWRTLGGLAHLAASATFMIALAYLLVRPVLIAPLDAGQSATHVAYARWFNLYFPDIPHWYPLEGGGESLLHGYSIVAHLVVVIFHRLSSLSILQAFRLVNFLSFPLTALGIYFLGLSTTRRQTVGLIAAGFYLLAPMTWTWVHNESLFPQGVAMVLFPVALTCFDRYLAHRLAESRSASRRIWFVCLVLSLGIASLLDLRVGAATALAILIYALFRSLLLARVTRGHSLIRAGRAAFTPVLAALLLIAFHLVSHFQYGQAANRGDLSAHSPDLLPLPTVSQFIGLDLLDPGHPAHRFQFPFVVAIFFLVGTIFARFYSSKILAICLMSLPGIAVLLVPQSQVLLIRIQPNLGALIGARAWLLILAILLPVGAAFGTWALAWTVVHPRTFLRMGSLKQRHSFPRLNLGEQVSSGLALSIAAVATLWMGGLATNNPSHVAYGPLPGGIDLRNVWDRTGTSPDGSFFQQFAPENWPEFAIGDDVLLASESQRLLSLLPERDLTRIDLSPHLGNLVAGIAAQSSTSQIRTQNNRISLIQPAWEYQKNVFYSHELGVDELGNPGSLNSSAQWFGTEFVFLAPDQDPIEIYEAAGWEPVHQEDTFQIWHNPNSPALANLTSRPAILVPEKPGREAYMTVFRLANDDLLPYEEAILVEGQEHIDRYTIEDLRPFDAIFLVGYDYKSRSKAWDTLAAYVEEGGSLFVDTGWQFAVAEWEFEQAPAVFPVNRLVWTDYGMAEEYAVGSSQIIGQVATDDFKPLIWEGEPWALSGADATDVRDWGQTVLSASGRPLIVAGEFGRGKVVWSGMNLIGHALYLGENEAELELLHNILQWLVGSPGEELAAPQVTREHPDRVKFSVSTEPRDTNWLYWREAYYPNWHAYLSDGTGTREIPVFRAGPGFILMPIETNSTAGSVALKWELSGAERWALLATAAGLAILAGFAIDGLFLGGNGLTWLRNSVFMKIPRPYLGNDANRDWAERKRAELEAGNSPDELRLRPPGESESKVSPDDLESNDEDRAQNPASDENEGNGKGEPSTIAEEEALLASWLDSTGHNEDAWAEKLLSKRKPKVSEDN